MRGYYLIKAAELEAALRNGLRARGSEAGGIGLATVPAAAFLFSPICTELRLLNKSAAMYSGLISNQVTGYIRAALLAIDLEGLALSCVKYFYEHGALSLWAPYDGLEDITELTKCTTTEDIAPGRILSAELVELPFVKLSKKPVFEQKTAENGQKIAVFNPLAWESTPEKVVYRREKA